MTIAIMIYILYDIVDRKIDTGILYNRRDIFFNTSNFNINLEHNYIIHFFIEYVKISVITKFSENK